MTAADDVFEEFDHEFDRLLHAGSEGVEFRSALGAVLNTVYQLREHLRSTLGDKQYFALADSSDDGRTTEGVVALRGIQVHSLARPLSPKNDTLYPGQHVFPGPYTFPGANLTWIDPDDVADELDMSRIRKDTLDRYRRHARGKMVLYTLDDARRFLAVNIAASQ